MDDDAMNSGLATREDLIECYRLFLDREPENEFVITEQLKNNPTIWEVIESFYLSKEHADKNRRISLYYIVKNYYIMRNLSIQDKIKIYIHNMEFLNDNMSMSSIVELIEEPPILYRDGSEGNDYNCTIQFERDTAREGEFSLYFSAGAEPIYCVSFTFFPGPIIGLPNPTVILVSRMQGKKGKFAQISQATKACDDVSPQAILWAVLQGVAIKMGVDNIVGVDAAKNLSYDEKSAEMLVKVYDRFYESVGAEKMPNGFFLFDASSDSKSEKPLPIAHRARNKRKREFKRAIVDEVIATWPIDVIGPGTTPARDPTSP